MAKDKRKRLERLKVGSKILTQKSRIQEQKTRAQELKTQAQEAKLLQAQIKYAKGKENVQSKIAKQKKARIAKRKAIFKKQFKVKIKPKHAIGTLNVLGINQRALPQKKKSSQRKFLERRIAQANHLDSVSNLNQAEILDSFELQKQKDLAKHIKESSEISESAWRQLNAIAKIQNKSKRDEISQRRRIRERAAVEKAMNPMKAHLNLNKIHLDFTGVSKDNILKSPNAFKEKVEDHILRPRSNSRTILDTGEDNTLKF